jgi:hypothetical protein
VKKTQAIAEDEEYERNEAVVEEDEYEENEAVVEEDEYEKNEAVAAEEKYEKYEAGAEEEKYEGNEAVAEDEEYEGNEAFAGETEAFTGDGESEEKEAVTEENDAVAEEKETVAKDVKGEIVVENKKDEVVVEDEIIEEAADIENEAVTSCQRHDFTEDVVGGDKEQDVINEKDIKEAKISDTIEEIVSDTKDISLDECKINAGHDDNGIVSPIQSDREMTTEKDIATTGEHEYDDNASIPEEEESQNDTQRPISTEDASIVQYHLMKSQW